MVCRRYRPRHPRASPVWQVFADHWPTYQRTLASHHPHLDHTVSAFLRCGDFRAGFTRWRCPDCAHEFLLAFTCKQRGLCASCHQRRTLTLAGSISGDLCIPVPHRHIVLTVPRLLRGVFQREPTLLHELFHAAQEVLVLWLRERTGHPDGQPGIIAALQTFGDFLAWHPHLHLLVTAGVFDGGAFRLAPTGGWSRLAELWRHAVLRRLREQQAIDDALVSKLLAWRHSGFTLDVGEAPLAADDIAGRRRLAEYLLRGPYSLEKITYEPRTGCVLYRSEKHWRTRRNFEVFSAVEFIAAVLRHLPAKGSPLVRYYGVYSNKSRGRHNPANARPGDSAAVVPARRKRSAWRQLILKVWGSDPLQCPLCQGRLRLLELVEEEADVRQVLTPLGLWSPADAPHRFPPAHAPPETWVDATGGSAARTLLTKPVPVDPHPWRAKAEPLAWRRFVFGEYTTHDTDDFDQTGCEWPGRADEPTDHDINQLTLFDDGWQPDAPEGEPVFWPGGGVQEFPVDDFVQHAPDEV
ncbi:MAG: transposase [Cephaloticoccus sp.]|nr:transposase [Cephaloticoccus sp.]MCF7759246.1 transposase [Cephaloticoccus sp.]